MKLRDDNYELNLTISWKLKESVGYETCFNCHGRGKVEDQDDYHFSGYNVSTVPCWACHGKGKTRLNPQCPQIPKEFSDEIFDHFQKVLRDNSPG